MPKQKDTIADNTTLKEVLDVVVSEIGVLTTKLKDCPNPILAERREEDTTETIYQKKVDYDTWLNDKLQIYKATKDTQPAAVFFIRSLIESLSNNSLTEKEIKTKIIDICKDMGIKTTGRGNIAGSPIDANMACSILCALGVIEPDISPTTIHYTKPSIEFLRLHSKLLAHPLSDPQQGDENGNDVKMEISEINGPSSSSSNGDNTISAMEMVTDNDDDKILTGDAYIDTELGLLPAGEGANLISILTERWRGALSKYFDEAQEIKKKTKDSSMNLSLVSGKIDNGDKHEDIDNSFDITNDKIFLHDNSLTMASEFHNEENLIDNFETTPDFITTIDTFNTDIQNGEISLNQFKDGEEGIQFFGDQVHVDGLEIEGLDQADHLAILESDNHKSKIRRRELSTEAVKFEMQNGQFEESTATVKRRSSNQRAWKLDSSTINNIITNPVLPFQNWAKACYEESLALEQEESLLRRIAAQCGIPIPESPFRLGTRYLNPQMADKQTDLDYESKSNNLGPKSFREGSVYTAAMLKERAKKIKKSKKVIRNSFNAHDGFHTFDENVVVAPRIPKKSDIMRFPAPLYLRQDYYTELKHELDGSLYASLNKETVLTANIVMPDLLIRSMEIPWKLVAKEFASLDNDSFESMVPIAQSPRNSDRMTANRVLNHRSTTDSFFNENSSIFKKASEVYAPAFRLVQPLSESTVMNDEGDSDEDISDEAILERHENVLKNMRDQWAMIKKLKKELKEMNTPGLANRTEITENGEIIPYVPTVGRKRSRSSNKSNKQKTQSSTGGGSSSPRKRGRPPKKNDGLIFKNDDKRDDSNDDQENDDSNDENYQDD